MMSSSPAVRPSALALRSLRKHNSTSRVAQSHVFLRLAPFTRSLSLSCARQIDINVVNVGPNFPRTRSWTPHRSLSAIRWNTFCTSSVSRTSTSPNSGTAPLRDETHPSLYYHLFASPSLSDPVFALTFSSKRPLKANSKAVIGWLPALSVESGEVDGNGLNDFEENGQFLQVLHDTIRHHILEDEIWVNGAIQAQSGWMHIFDQRNPPPLGRIPDPNDIIGSVRVEDGKMLPDTYAPMPTYRLATGDGVCTLTERLMERVVERLENDS